MRHTHEKDLMGERASLRTIDTNMDQDIRTAWMGERKQEKAEVIQISYRNVVANYVGEDYPRRLNKILRRSTFRVCGRGGRGVWYWYSLAREEWA